MVAWLDNSRSDVHAARMSARSIVVGLAAVATIVAGCTDAHDATPSTPASTGVISSPTTESSPSSTVPPTTSMKPSTTTPTPDVITRPYVDPVVCGPGAKAEHTLQNITLFPFAVSREAPIPLQVLASPTDGVAKPFAVVLRLSATGDDRANDHPVSINGWQVSITDWGNGNQQAAWTLPDGTWAYLRARDLDEPTLVALISRLTPRGPGAPIPGFDLAPSTAPDDLTLLHEHLNTDLSGTVTRFQCSTEPNQGIYHIDVVQGDPVFVYFGVLDRPHPYAVGVNGSGAITIFGSVANRALTLTDITDADPATWDALPEIGPFGTMP